MCERYTVRGSPIIPLFVGERPTPNYLLGRHPSADLHEILLDATYRYEVFPAHLIDIHEDQIGCGFGSCLDIDGYPAVLQVEVVVRGLGIPWIAVRPVVSYSVCQEIPREGDLPPNPNPALHRYHDARLSGP